MPSWQACWRCGKNKPPPEGCSGGGVGVAAFFSADYFFSLQQSLPQTLPASLQHAAQLSLQHFLQASLAARAGRALPRTATERRSKDVFIRFLCVSMDLKRPWKKTRQTGTGGSNQAWIAPRWAGAASARSQQKCMIPHIKRRTRGARWSMFMQTRMRITDEFMERLWHRSLPTREDRFSIQHGRRDERQGFDHVAWCL